VEALGPNSTSPLLDAEVIVLAMRLLKEFGVKGLKLKINSLGSKEDKAVISSWLREQLAHYKQDLCEECRVRFDRNIFRVLDCKNESCRKVVRTALGADLNLPMSQESRQYFQKVGAALTDLNIVFEVSPQLVRGLDYYTHTVFEITAEGLGSQDAVGAGGRYGGLVHELGGNEKVDYGAVGFALGIERILLAGDQAAHAAWGMDVYVIAMKEEYQPQAFLLLQQLRDSGIAADMSFSGGSVKSQMGRADKANARFALIIGDQEFNDKTLTVKNMQKSTQETIASGSIMDYLRKAS